MDFQKVIRFLLPREDQFFDMLLGHSKKVCEAAKALAMFGQNKIGADEVSAQVLKIEQEGDELAHALEIALAKTFVTPIDREDIQQLATDLDHILDACHLSALSFKLYALDQPSPEMASLMNLLVEGTSLVSEGFAQLKTHDYDEIRSTSSKIREVEKRGDDIFRAAIAQLFRNEEVECRQFIRDKDLLEDLENALDACEEVAERLAHLAIKNA
jgi:uncharacterized protein